MNYFENGREIGFSPTADKTGNSIYPDHKQKEDFPIAGLADLVWQRDNALVTSNFHHTVNIADLERQIEKIIASMGNNKKELLWKTVKFMLAEAAVRSLSILHYPNFSEPIIEIGSMSEPEFIQAAMDDYKSSEKKYSFNPYIHLMKNFFIPVALDIYDPEPDGQYEGHYPDFPFKSLVMNDNLEMTRICANVGHEFHSFPLFATFGWPRDIGFFALNGEMDRIKGKAALVVATYPHLFKGAEWMLESIKAMTDNDFPKKELDLTEVLEVVSDEGAIRAFGDNNVERMEYSGRIFTNKIIKISESESRRDNEFIIRKNIAPNLKIIGNTAALHTLYYQFVKNTIEMLKIPIYQVKKPVVSMDAKECEVNGTKLIAVRFTDNGPGLEFHKILRAKQRILMERHDRLTEAEKRIIGGWTSLDLRLVDLINFIFDRRVSGADRMGGRHSGIGMALAKEIIDEHGGCIWATNNSGEEGAKFLIILDRTGKGELKKNMRKLFQTDDVPSEILEEIERQMA